MAFGHDAIQDVIVRSIFTDKRSVALAGSSEGEFSPVRFQTIALAATAVSIRISSVLLFPSTIHSGLIMCLADTMRSQ